MKILYLDLACGISGDMFLATLIDLGLKFDDLKTALSTINLSGYELRLTSKKFNGIGATDFEVVIDKNAPKKHRRLNDIIALIASSGLPREVKKRAAAVFETLAEAEAKVHQTSKDKIHFHEVGAVDSIIDICGCLVGLEFLEIDKVLTSTPVLGCGEVSCQHGIIPVPSPATLEILKGVEVKFSDEPGEKITPTGAALIKSLARIGVRVSGELLKTGYGAGKRQDGKRANLLRGVLLESQQCRTEVFQEKASIFVIETNIDDMNPELLPPLMDKLLLRGALDVYCAQLQMKKGRHGIKLSVLANEADLDKFSEVMLRESSSFGVRYYPVERKVLMREHAVVSTRYGDVEVKVGYWDGKVLKVTPEFESASSLSVKQDVSLFDIYVAVNEARLKFKMKTHKG